MDSTLACESQGESCSRRTAAFWPGAAVAHTRGKRPLEKCGILRLTGYGLNREFTLSAKSRRSQLHFLFVPTDSTGKTTIAKNLAHLALLAGHSARFTTASAMLNDLAAQDSTAALNRRLRHYCRPTLLVVDELGYLSYDSRYADLLFEVVTRRYQQRPTVITTNKPFAEWNQVFPNATSVVTIIDRLVHKAEILTIEADSYCLKEAKERAAQKARGRKQRKPGNDHE